MAIPWQSIGRAQTPQGELELRKRDEDEFLITIAGRVLMNSRANRSEQVLAQAACNALAGFDSPRVLIGGLGMGCTLRRAAEALPATATIEVCELNEVVREWCAGPLAELNGHVLEDPRVHVFIADVARTIEARAREKKSPRFDAIVIDLYEGPHPRTDATWDPFYGRVALDATRRALSKGGVFAVWSEAPDRAFEKRLEKVGFEVEKLRAGRGGRRHVVYLARRVR
ncbi:MAG: spermidine synthase [Myxococcota bacterium]|jgi:spermidine synthase|nr:spermidine synthase [Myxococcota bacterium]